MQEKFRYVIPLHMYNTVYIQLIIRYVFALENQTMLFINFYKTLIELRTKTKFC